MSQPALKSANSIVDLPLPPPDDECRERLAAQWALRLVLLTPAGQKLLAARNQADDVLAVIGPWVDWPVAMQRAFIQHLFRDGGLPAADEEATGTAAPRRRKTAPLTDPGAIDWRSVDWSELSPPFCDLYQRQRERVVKALKTALHRLEATPVNRHDDLVRNITLLADLLKLNPTERALLLFFAIATENGRLRMLLGHMPFVSMQKAATVLGSVLDLPSGPVIAALRGDGVLRRCGLIESSRRMNDLDDLIQLGNQMREIVGYPHESIEDLMAHFVTDSPAGQLNAADYPHLSAAHADLVPLLTAALRERQAGVNVLLYGPPGTGKTEFARLLAAATGAQLYAVIAHDEQGNSANTHERLLGHQLAQSFLRENPSALVLFDEVEDIFGGDAGMAALSQLFGGSGGHQGNGRKAWLNQVLETNPVPTLWIANRIGGFDPAFLRRFLYTVELGIPPASVRQRIVSRHLDALELSPACRDRLAHEQVSPAQLETLSKVVKLIQPAPGVATEALLTRTLEASMSAMGQPRTPVRDAVTGYRLDYLNIDSRLPVERLVTAAQTTGRLTLCLAGPPGTGKTQFAHYLAEQLDRPLLARRASDILDKWVGASERNLARMFREARDENAVLLLDEADSLLRSRESAEHQWEVTQVNELLTQMETFDGIFICATNRFEHLDPAALRRFTAKLSFGYLTADQRWRLLLQETGLSPDQTFAQLRALRQRLDRLATLTPGDYATVKRQALALGESLAAADFIERLEEEIRIKQAHAQTRTIGFVQ